MEYVHHSIVITITKVDDRDFTLNKRPVTSHRSKLITIEDYVREASTQWQTSDLIPSVIHQGSE
jgi:hypothetical protein